MHESLNRLIEHYGALGVLIVTIVEGEFGPLVGGAMARLGKLDLLPLVFICWFGAALSTTVFFAIGRSQRDGRLVHKVTDKRAFALALKWIDRHPRLFCFFYRFVYGLRIVGPVTISLSHVRSTTFLLINTIASLLWAILALGIGWAVGPGAVRTVAYYFTERPYLMASVIAAALLIGAVSWRARRSAKRAALTQAQSQSDEPIVPPSTAA